MSNIFQSKNTYITYMQGLWLKQGHFPEEMQEILTLSGGRG